MKKLTALILVVLLLIGISVPATASTETEGQNYTVEKSVVEQMNNRYNVEPVLVNNENEENQLEIRRSELLAQYRAEQMNGADDMQLAQIEQQLADLGVVKITVTLPRTIYTELSSIPGV